ncbi:PDDEXK nuclease domain-containing protein [Nostoc commune]|uniref:PDDEXK nuclease domain-containing protein n=1 Tax=Nostoc commune TaxID=1178 RepID=UPI0039BFFCB8
MIDLKIEEFKPEFSGKMNFYVSAVDDLLRHADDQPTIGMILCKSKNKVNRVHLENCSYFSMKRKNPHPPASSPKFGRRGAAKLSLSHLGRGI